MASESLITVASCALNQWALDFDGNLKRVKESCKRAKAAGATYRLGPELELPGYGCEDHFFEIDTLNHSWDSLYDLLYDDDHVTDGLLCDFGMPLLFRGVRYNCRVFCVDRKIVWIRPKAAMADHGNYRESRYFTAYPIDGASADMTLPPKFHEFQKTAPFGHGRLQCGKANISLGVESCEELWTPAATHIGLALGGVEIITNGSGSHHELRKGGRRLELMIHATRTCGGLYLYSNQRGCDGGRMYFDGGACIVCNGQILACTEPFGVEDDVQMAVATIDIDDVRSYRSALASWNVQATNKTSRSAESQDLIIDCPDVDLTVDSNKAIPSVALPTTSGDEPSQIGSVLPSPSPEEECCHGPACWMWDYLRRSGASGFVLPLSGGADSSAVCAIVAVMTEMVMQAVKDGHEDVAADVKRVCGGHMPKDAQDFASYIFHTIYMGTEHSSKATQSRAERLSDTVGSYHLNVPIDAMVKAVLGVYALATGSVSVPQFLSRGGTLSQDLALQNLQARLRMVTAYLFAQLLLPLSRGKKANGKEAPSSSGFLLVLGSANVDEGLRGYMTKYDCSSADINPIGGISKGDLNNMLKWVAKKYDWPILQEIAEAPPTAELRPNDDGEDANAEHSQLDEDDMGMTYKELGAFGTLRKVARCGPVSMFRKLSVMWRDTCTPAEVATKVKRFFYYYSVNRHKMCTLTPSYHAEGYSPDDNRFDLRPFLYNTKWPRQFETIDALVAEMDGAKELN